MLIDGKLLDHTESDYIWLNRALLGDVSNVPSADILPTIHTPLLTASLSRMVSLLKVALKHNFFSALTIMAGGILALNYTTVTRQYSGCPVVIALGPSETGKSTVIKAALSITGKQLQYV